MSCHHEIHTEALKLLHGKQTDRVQCLKCGQSLSEADLPKIDKDHKAHKSDAKKE